MIVPLHPAPAAHDERSKKATSQQPLSSLEHQSGIGARYHCLEEHVRLNQKPLGSIVTGARISFSSQYYHSVGLRLAEKTDLTGFLNHSLCIGCRVMLQSLWRDGLAGRRWRMIDSLIRIIEMRRVIWRHLAIRIWPRLKGGCWRILLCVRGKSGGHFESIGPKRECLIIRSLYGVVVRGAIS